MTACGGKTTTKDSKAPQADVVVGDVDGGTVVSAAMPDPRKVNPPKNERRVLSHTECRAFLHHAIELAASELNQDPATLQSMLYDPKEKAVCDTSIFSDEIFDCILATKTQAELPACMKFGEPSPSP